jgi:hypothetical protein
VVALASVVVVGSIEVSTGAVLRESGGGRVAGGDDVGAIVSIDWPPELHAPARQASTPSPTTARQWRMFHLLRRSIAGPHTIDLVDNDDTSMPNPATVFFHTPNRAGDDGGHSV